MKRFFILFVFCICANFAQAQDIDVSELLHTQPEKALEIINQALDESPNSEELLRLHAAACEILNQYDKAVAGYNHLTQLSPDEENLWYLLGRNQHKNGQLHDALRSLNRATNLNTKYLPAYHTKIQVLLQLNQDDAALKVSDSTLLIAETAMTYFLQGEVYSKLKSWQKAGWAYQSATKIDRGFIDAYIALANISANANKAGETLEAAEAALGIDSDSKEALIARSRGYALSKDYNYAIEDVAYVITLDPNNVNARYLRGTYYIETNKPQEAIKDFEQILKIQPDYWQALAGLADCYAKTGNKTAALEGYKQLLEIADNYSEKDVIVQFANRQIFELNREYNPPVITLIEPPHENFNINAPDNLQSIIIKGKIADESPIKSLTVNGQSIPVTQIGDYYEFVAIVKLENIHEMQIEATDAYDNVTKETYRLILTETLENN